MQPTTGQRVMYKRQYKTETAKAHYEMGDEVVDENEKVTHHPIFVFLDRILHMRGFVPSCHCPFLKI